MYYVIVLDGNVTGPAIRHFYTAMLPMEGIIIMEVTVRCTFQYANTARTHAHVEECTFPNKVHHQGLESTRPQVLMIH